MSALRGPDDKVIGYIGNCWHFICRRCRGVCDDYEGQWAAEQGLRDHFAECQGPLEEE